MILLLHPIKKYKLIKHTLNKALWIKKRELWKKDKILTLCLTYRTTAKIMWEKDKKAKSKWNCLSVPKNKWKLHNINPKGKFILLPQEQSQLTSVSSLIRRTINSNWHTNTITHPITNPGHCWLTWLYLAVDCSSMPITTDTSYKQLNHCPIQLFWINLF